MKLVSIPLNWYEPPSKPSGPGANSTFDASPGGFWLWLMSVVSYCPFNGKKATGFNGTKKKIEHKNGFVTYFASILYLFTKQFSPQGRNMKKINITHYLYVTLAEIACPSCLESLFIFQLFSKSSRVIGYTTCESFSQWKENISHYQDMIKLWVTLSLIRWLCSNY